MSFESATLIQILDKHLHPVCITCMFIRLLHVYHTNATLRTALNITIGILESRKHSGEVTVKNCSKLLSLLWSRSKSVLPCESLSFCDQLEWGGFIAFALSHSPCFR